MKCGSCNILIGLALIIVVGVSVMWQKYGDLYIAEIMQEYDEMMTMQEDDTMLPTDIATTTAENPSGTSSVTPASTGGITTADVAAHNSRTSCWATINGSVYDLTSWIPHHPGGEQAILQLCGTDGTAKFTRQHGRSSKVASILSGFKIGVAAN